MAIRAGILTALILILSPPAQAHGPAPSPLRVLHVSDGQPQIIQTNIGLALRSQEGTFSYGCPSQWGDLETPVMAALNADTLFVVGPDALYVSQDRGCNFAPIEDPLNLEEPRINALIAAEGQIWGVEKGADRARLFVWSPDAGLTLVSEIQQPIDSMILVGDALILAGARPEPRLFRVALDGSDVQPIALVPPTDSGIQRLSLRFVDPGSPSRWWLAATTDDGIELWRTDDSGQRFETLIQGDLSMHGPVPLCGGFVAVVDGVMTPDPGFAPSCDIGALVEKRLNCLGTRGGLVWTCELRQLYQIIDRDGALSLPRIFAFDLLGPPASACPGEQEARLECEQDWLHYGAESGLIDPEDIFGTGEPDPNPTSDPDPQPTPSPAPTGETPSGGGCSTPPGSPVGAPLIPGGLFAIGWLYQRRRLRTRPPAAG